MSLTCFFGQEIQPNGNPVSPIIPPKSTLVITQACVTAAYPTGGAVTLYVQSHNITSKLAVCTLHPDKGIFHWAIQLLFSGSVTFYLVPTNPDLPSKENSGAGGKKGGKKTSTDEKEATKELVPLPTIHLMGYYEAEDEGQDEDDDDDDDEDSDEDEESDEGEFVSGSKRKRSGQQQQHGQRGRGASQGRGAAAAAPRGRGRGGAARGRGSR